MQKRNLLSYLFVRVKDIVKGLGVFLNNLTTLYINFQLRSSLREQTHVDDVDRRALSCISGLLVDGTENTVEKQLTQM